VLILVTNIAAGLEVREDVIRRHVLEQMPFMATERGSCSCSGRRRSPGAARGHPSTQSRGNEAVCRGAPNDLLDRLAADPAFRDIPTEVLRAELEPANYTGRAGRQVGEFLGEYLHPLLARARPLAAEPEAAEIRV